MTDARAHWDKAYSAKAETDVSWYQQSPKRSLAMVESAPHRAASIIDVGGGASRLTDELLAAGYSDLTVLDISDIALSRSRSRLGNLANKVTWIAADITQWEPKRIWDVWHDRAVFHFLTDFGAQDAYINALMRGTTVSSTVIMATFALNGPEKCSGLPVQRYSPQTLAARLGPSFALVAESGETHLTPSGTTQEFIYAAFKRHT